MKRIKVLLQNLIPIILSISLYVMLIIYMEPKGLEILWMILLQIVFFVIGFSLSTIIHEGGHMVFGLISGYHLTSFRFGPFSINYNGEKYKFELDKMNLGILGQCLMSPPKPKKKIKPKFYLYNAGGLIFSYLLLVIMLLMFFLIDAKYNRFILAPMIFIDFYLSIINTIPTKGGLNDVCNYLNVKKNPKYIDAILYQLEVTTNVFLGKRMGTKTLYTGYYEIPLDHITLPNALFKFYYEIDHDNYDNARVYINDIKKSLSHLVHIQHHLLSIYEIVWFDLAIDKNIARAKIDFSSITDMEKRLLITDGTIFKAYYDMYNEVINGNNDIDSYVKLILDESDSSGEMLSTNKRFEILKRSLTESENKTAE